MDENNLLKKIQQSIKDEIRPVKDIVELAKKKIDSNDVFLHSTAENVRRIKEQQSLMNEKLDEVKETLMEHTGSLAKIESTIKVYGDMYKLNNDNMKKLEKRVGVLEDNVDIKPAPENILASLH